LLGLLTGGPLEAMNMQRLGWDPSMEDDDSGRQVQCRRCGDEYCGATYESCPVCWQGPGLPGVPEPIEEERTERIERETNADVVSRGLL
jgi:hypothetical protein